ncbi:MAG TPA: hypothetical protein VEC57_16545 [Candidatus Limnocylindrales bacterium]|nr:hypothetical protein [Candidatus Limnocylindrales bacterium]
MRTIALLMALLCTAPAHAKVVNVEFKFTPFIGDTKKDEVETVPGRAVVYVNDIPISEDTVEKQQVPVLFDEREVAPSVWVSMESSKSVVRRGKNKFRVEFVPNDEKTPYKAELRWASVNDEETRTGDLGHGTITNQSDEGVDTRQAKGRIVLEREFQADFATEQKWHHYPPVASLSDEDKKELASLVAARVDLYKPDFDKLYTFLKQNPALEADVMRKQKCLEKAYEAGVRIAAVDAAKMQFATTGSAAVVVRGPKGGLYYPPDPEKFGKIMGDELQMCASAALYVAFPPRLLVAKAPNGSWEVLP